MTDFSELEARIDQALGGQRFRLRQRLRSIEQARRAGKPYERNLERWRQELEQSVQWRAERLAGLPSVALDPALPITAKCQEIQDAIREHAVTIVCGETGSGKSTHLPKICLQLGRGVDGLIGHTQPRRIAARAIAAALAGRAVVKSTANRAQSAVATGGFTAPSCTPAAASSHQLWATEKVKLAIGCPIGCRLRSAAQRL